MILGKNGIKIKLVSLDAEFSVEQHIQNPQIFFGKKIYGCLKCYANIVQQGINIQSYDFLEIKHPYSIDTVTLTNSARNFVYKNIAMAYFIYVPLKLPRFKGKQLS